MSPRGNPLRSPPERLTSFRAGFCLENGATGLGNLQGPMVRIAADFACRVALTNHCSPVERLVLWPVASVSSLGDQWQLGC